MMIPRLLHRGNGNLLNCNHYNFRRAADTYRRTPQTVAAGSNTQHAAELFTAIIQQIHSFRY